MSRVCGAYRSLRALLLATIAVVILTEMPRAQAQQPAAVQGTAVNFNIPAQSLTSALTAFARQSGVRLAYPASLTAGKSAPALNGQFTRSAALSRLLSDSGLVFSFTATNTATISDPSAGGNNATATVDGAIALDTIDVRGGSGSGFQGTPDWVYQTPSSGGVVTREALRMVPARDTRDAIATAPGVYSGQGNGSFPTVSPNIRGLQDSGRIVVAIDGARQNAQRGFGAGSSGYQSNSGQAFVDSAFVREVDISKNPEAKAGSAASLGGGVNFRTVGADDLIVPGKTWGMEANATHGTNEFDFQGSALMATRIGNALSLTMGMSKLKVGEYLPGQHGGEVASSGSLKGRDSWSSFLKLEGKFGDVKTSLSWMHQQNNFAYQNAAYENQEDARNDSVSAKTSWKPDNPLIDVNASLWLSNTGMTELRPARQSFYPETEINTGFLSFGGVLENTSRLDTAAGALKLNYGVEAFRDRGTAEASNTSIAQNPTWANAFTSFSPAGERDVVSTYLNGEFKPASWVTVSAGIRYDWSRLHGTPTYYNRWSTGGGRRIVGNTTDHLTFFIQTNSILYIRNQSICSTGEYNGRTYNATQQAVACNALTTWQNQRGEIIDGRWYDEGGTYIEPTVSHEEGYTLDIDRTDGALLPSATVEFKPVEWFRPFVSYGQSYRPPSVLEAFFNGSLPQDGLGLVFAPNVDLRAEQARTFEIGANILRDGLLTQEDSFRFKAVAFHREIDDFIVLGYIATAEAATPNKTYTSFVNLDGPTTMRGIEIEANYDFRAAWIGAGVSLLETDWPKRTQIFSNGVTTTNGQVIAVPGTVPPEYKLTLDGGVRLFDEKLALGVRYTRVGPTQVNQADLNIGGDLVISDHSKAYSLIDLYGSLKFNDNTTMRFAVNNLMDINYIPATASFNAPGRTVTFGYHVKF